MYKVDMRKDKTEGKNQAITKKMERYSMFIHKETKYCPDISSSQLGLWIQCSHKQILANYFVYTNKPIVSFI